MAQLENTLALELALGLLLGAEALLAFLRERKEVAAVGKRGGEVSSSSSSSSSARGRVD